MPRWLTAIAVLASFLLVGCLSPAQLRDHLRAMRAAPDVQPDEADDDRDDAPQDGAVRRQQEGTEQDESGAAQEGTAGVGEPQQAARPAGECDQNQSNVHAGHSRNLRVSKKVDRARRQRDRR